MSRAFVKDETVAEAVETVLPERPISPHPNLVTASGLKALEEALQSARDALSKAASLQDAIERKRHSAAPARDIRYLSERLTTAQLVTPAPSPETVGFGNSVKLEYEDGREVTYRIVGEDEADPAKGLISYVSPVARALIGQRAGATVTVAGREIVILQIS